MVGGLSGGGRPAWACSCAPNDPIHEIAEADAVFFGVPGLKGDLPETAIVTGHDDTTCGPAFGDPRAVIVMFATDGGGAFETWACAESRRASWGGAARRGSGG